MRVRSLIRTVDNHLGNFIFTFGINKNQTTCTFSRVRHKNRVHDGVSVCVRPPPPYTGNVSWLLVLAIQNTCREIALTLTALRCGPGIEGELNHTLLHGVFYKRNAVLVHTAELTHVVHPLSWCHPPLRTRLQLFRVVSERELRVRYLRVQLRAPTQPCDGGSVVLWRHSRHAGINHWRKGALWSQKLLSGSSGKRL